MYILRSHAVTGEVDSQAWRGSEKNSAKSGVSELQEG